MKGKNRPREDEVDYKQYLSLLAVLDLQRARYTQLAIKLVESLSVTEDGVTVRDEKAARIAYEYAQELIGEAI